MRTQGALYPVLCDLWTLHGRPVGPLFPALCEHWVLFPLILLGFFTWLQAVFACICADQLSAEHPQGVLFNCPHFTSVQLSYLWFSVRRPWATMAHCNSGRFFSGLIQDPSSCAVAWKLRQSQGYFQFFPISQGLQSCTAWCPRPEKSVSCIYSFCSSWWFRMEGKSVPVTPSWPESEFIILFEPKSKQKSHIFLKKYTHQ